MTTAIERYRAMLPRNPGCGGMTDEAAVIWHVLLSAHLQDDLHGDVAEVGVFRGFGASLMGGYLRDGEKLILIDKFANLDDARAALVEVCGEQVLGQTVFHQQDSYRLGRTQTLEEGRELRFMHIDGEHSYDAVINDLLLATRNVAPHAVVVVDDFFSAASPAITHAVFDFLREPTSNLSMFLVGYNKAYLCLNRWLGYYRQLSASLPIELEKFGHAAQLAAGGFAFERTYLGISPRATKARYQLIGSFVPEESTLLSATNLFV